MNLCQASLQNCLVVMHKELLYLWFYNLLDVTEHTGGLLCVEFIYITNQFAVLLDWYFLSVCN